MVAQADVGLREGTVRSRTWTDPGYQAFRILHLGFAALPAIAGVDKFSKLLSDWTRYLSPTFAAASPLSAQATMYLVGLIEIAAGFLVAVMPRVGAYVVAGWLGAIILNLLLLGTYWDVALRDLGLMLGALALARLARRYRPA